MELSKRVIALVESWKLTEDIRQDFYVFWLESDAYTNHEVRCMVDKDFAALLWTYNNNLRRNQQWKDNNRSRIEQDNQDAISRALGLNPTGADDDPMEIIMANEEIGIKLKQLSPLLRATLERVVVEGVTPEELAVEEGTSANVIYQRMNQAKRLLKGESND